MLKQQTLQTLRRWIAPAGTMTTMSQLERHSSNLMWTDTAVMQAFSEAVRDRMLFDDTNKQWLVANDRRIFAPSSSEVAQGVVAQYMKEVSAGADAQLAKSLQSVSRINAVLQLSKSQLRCDPCSFDSDAYLAGCRNGVLNLKTRRLVSPESVITKRLGTHFDPDAQCPRFLAFVSQILAGDNEVGAFLKRSIGYSLTARISEQCLFLCIGTGANGKSTLLRVLQRLLGDYAGSTPMHTLMASQNGNDRTDDLAALKGKRLVCAQEGEAGRRLAEAKIKLMTGGDPITCRPLYGNLFTYEPQFKLWLATNDLPRISGNDDAVWRRIHIIEFPVTIPPEERDPNLFESLIEELPGILNWCLDGLAEWERVSLSPPDAVLRSTGSYRSENDTVGQFVEAACIGDAEARVLVKELYAEYAKWCDNSGYDLLSTSQFGKELTRLGFEVVKTKTGNARKGIRLADE